MKEEEEETCRPPEQRGTNALRDTTFVFRREGLTEDEVYALLTENASGVLDPEPEKFVPAHRRKPQP